MRLGLTRPTTSNRRRRQRHADEVMGIDMNPMIDMTFQLIAFFMFVLNFNNDIIDERVTLPRADNAAPTEDSPQAPVFLNMDRTGEVLLPGGEQADPRSSPEPVRRALQLEARLAEQNMRASGEDPSEGLWTTIVIRADRRSPYGAVQSVIQLAQEIGFTKFWLRAEQQAQ